VWGGRRRRSPGRRKGKKKNSIRAFGKKENVRLPRPGGRGRGEEEHNRQAEKKRDHGGRFSSRKKREVGRKEKLYIFH